MSIGKIALGLFVAASTTQAAVLVDDRFIDGGFGDGTDAKDLSWSLYIVPVTNTPSLSMASDNTTGPNEGGNDSALQVNVSSQGFRGVFGILPAAQSLAIGDKLALNFDMDFTSGTGNTSAAVRFGLYNSNLTTTPTNDNGYFARMATGSGSPAIEAWKETGTDVVLSGGDTSVIAGGTGSGFVGIGGTTVNLGITLTRLAASSMRVELTQSGNVVWTATDSASSFFAFDEIALGTGTNNTDYRLDNIVLTYTAVPEPAALSLLAAAGLLMGRRRRD